MTREATAVLFVLASSVAFLPVVAYSMGRRRGVLEEKLRQDDAATVICPNCANLEAPARRLMETGAVVKAVNWYGDSYPSGSPVDDANQVLRLVKAYVHTVDRRKNG